METFCPLCEKNGIRRRVKAFQINLEEAVLACEAEECSWPIGYEELTFFARKAASCKWEESNPTKEDTPVPMEFTLYTPPVTPGGELSKELPEIVSPEYSSYPATEDKIGTLPKCEFIASTKDSTICNKSSLLESLELEDINSQNRSLVNEQIACVKTLPKIINIEQTNINLKIFSNIGEHCDNRQIEERSLDMNVMDTIKNLDISDSAYIEFNLNKQYVGSEQNESDKLYLNATVNEAETNFDAKTLSETMNTLIDLDVTNNLSTTNGSIENISSNDILEDILKNESHIPLDLNDDWLNMLMS